MSKKPVADSKKPVGVSKKPAVVSKKPAVVTGEPVIRWLSEPEEHDYPAAQSYLSLVHDEEAARGYVEGLKRAAIVQYKAKDIFRASGLSLLGVSNSHVEKDRRKIVAGDSLSPLLLVRDTNTGRVVIVDGYHRMCAVYAIDEDAAIPRKIVS